MFKAYYNLTKPGIIYGNAVNTAAGFFLASQGRYDFKLFLVALIGISLVVASACVFNNILDKKIDAKMERTKNRTMVLGAIKTPSAIIFGVILLILGMIDLALSTNNLALYAALLGFLTYVFLYTFSKRHTIWATEIGSISGAMPGLVGYLAVTNRFNAGAGILFLILALWQMPHFYAIAIYRLDEYKQAGIPVLPAVKGILRTKINMLVYIIAFIFALSALTIYGYTGYLYLAVMGLLGLIWLWMTIKGFKKAEQEVNAESAEALAKAEAKKMFRFSLIIVLAFCITIPLDHILR